MEDPVQARRREATILLRKRKQPVSRVVCWAPDAVLWIDQRGEPRTTFVTKLASGEMAVSQPCDGFVI